MFILGDVFVIGIFVDGLLVVFKGVFVLLLEVFLLGF